MKYSELTDERIAAITKDGTWREEYKEIIKEFDYSSQLECLIHIRYTQRLLAILKERDNELLYGKGTGQALGILKLKTLISNKGRYNGYSD